MPSQDTPSSSHQLPSWQQHSPETLQSMDDAVRGCVIMRMNSRPIPSHHFSSSFQQRYIHAVPQDHHPTSTRARLAYLQLILAEALDICSDLEASSYVSPSDHHDSNLRILYDIVEDEDAPTE